jgi:hypothetical protein
VKFNINNKSYLFKKSETARCQKIPFWKPETRKESTNLQ